MWVRRKRDLCKRRILTGKIWDLVIIKQIKDMYQTLKTENGTKVVLLMKQQLQ